MATVQTNTGAMRWLNGGKLTITGTSDSYVINNIHDGAVSIMFPKRENIHFKDRGVYQAPLEGDDTLGELSVTAHCGALYAATATLLSLLIADGPTTTNVALEYSTVIMDFPDSRGGSTGQRVTFNNVSIDAGSVKWEKGDQTPDQISFTAKFRSVSEPVAY